MKATLMLTVAMGSILHLPGQRPIALDGVPDDAEKHWENGERWLMLKKDSGEALSGYSKTKLEELLKVRTAVGYQPEIDQLAKALKAAKADKPAKPEKEIQPN